MMSLNAIEEFAEEFLAAKKIFDEIGFEIVGTQDINEDQIFFVKKRKNNWKEAFFILVIHLPISNS